MLHILLHLTKGSLVKCSKSRCLSYLIYCAILATKIMCWIC